ncbi:hypothetical protein GCM10010345_30640 [Streptomyces canarius]|uniref:Transposase n=1 Tax=Streptomyces canarius TaxID=285453 RepID=A0ABQ3CKU9_9ACTN|nr:hypothetical protein GCM10010345_30640 [Streptomyces canarius]
MPAVEQVEALLRVGGMKPWSCWDQSSTWCGDAVRLLERDVRISTKARSAVRDRSKAASVH